MYIMDFIIAGILILFLAAAYQDYKKREVDDLITAFAWVLSALVFDLHYFILFFAGVWIIAVVCEKLKKPLFGFGDVLFFPVYAGMIARFGQDPIIVSLLTVLGAQLYLWYQLEWLNLPNKKVNGSPFVLIMLLGITIAALLRIFSG